MTRARGPAEQNLPSGPQPTERAAVWAKHDPDSKKRNRTNRARAIKAARTRKKNKRNPTPEAPVTVTNHQLWCLALRSGKCDCAPP